MFAVVDLPANPDGNHEGRKWVRLEHTHCHPGPAHPQGAPWPQATGESMANCVLFVREAGGGWKPPATSEWLLLGLVISRPEHLPAWCLNGDLEGTVSWSSCP